MSTGNTSSALRRSCRKRLSLESSKSEVSAMQRNKSIRLHRSQTLNIPMNDLSDLDLCNNYFLKAPQQTFDLTYLGSDDTLNPESLALLEELKNQEWQVYSAGCIFNFSNLESDRKWLANECKKALEVEFENSKFDSYHIDIDVLESYNITENDYPAIAIKVYGVTREGREQTMDLQYGCLMLSWCNPLPLGCGLNVTTLPVLLCQGDKRVRSVMHQVLSNKLDTTITKLELMQEDFKCISTYCLAMLSPNDRYTAQLIYTTPFGEIEVSVKTEDLLKLWKQFQPEDTTEVKLDTVLRFQDSLHSFLGATYGIKFDLARFRKIRVNRAFSLSSTSPMRFDSTKVGHVVLKFLTNSIIHKLKLELIEKSRSASF